MKSKGLLWLECITLFGGLPLVLSWLQLRGGFPFLPVLLAFLVITLGISRNDSAISFRPPSTSPAIRSFLIRLGIVAVSLLLLTAFLYPDLFLRLPRQRTRLWMLILILYPLLSVAPQEFLYRTFFMQRYVPIFGQGKGLFWANVFFFGWGHIFFLNWVAPLLSLLGGILLTRTWQQTKSFKWVCIEHAIYGQLVFTSGIGWWFYTGSAQSIQSVTGG